MKPLSLILKIAAILGGLVAVVLFFLAQGKLSDLNQQLEVETTARQTAETGLANANKEIAGLETDLEQASSSLDATRDELGQLKTEMVLKNQELEATREELVVSENNLTSKDNELRELRRELVAAESQLAQAVSLEEADQLRSRIKDLDTSVTRLSDELATEKARNQALVSGRSGSGGADGEGSQLRSGSIGPEVTIASVDPTGGVLVLTGGAEAGLQRGNSVRLIKDLEAIGSIRISEVKDEFMIASIQEGSSLDALVSGMRVNVIP